MTQEEYEAKVQSMPKELQNQFRESLEIGMSKRIVNRFMAVVMQAYAQGQRDTQKANFFTGDEAYMHGAEDMLEAMKTICGMDVKDATKNFNIDVTNIGAFTDVRIPLMENALKMNGGNILEIVDKYRDEKMQEKDEREKAAVKAIADTIGIDRLLEIANAMKQEDDLPF